MAATDTRKTIKLALFAALPVLAASVLGGLFTGPAIPGWYAGLAKPSFNPPNWVFGPVWTLLYAMMAYAFFRILRLTPGLAGRSMAIVSFAGQLILNAAWSGAFFGLQSPAAGLIVIMPLLGLILLTIVLFMRLDRVAGWLLVPYALWVSFATLLNFTLWRLN
jgi:tryptophan-rich sensory protein